MDLVAPTGIVAVDGCAAIDIAFRIANGLAVVEGFQLSDVVLVPLNQVGQFIDEHSLQEREKHLGTFSVHVRLMVLELASLEKKKERRKKMTIFDFFKIRFLES